MAKSKVTSAKLAKLASKVLKGYDPTRDEIEALAASVMSQRERDLAAKEAEKAPVVEEAAPAEVVVPAVEVAVEAPAVEEAPVAEAAAEEAPAKTSWWTRVFK